MKNASVGVGMAQISDLPYSSGGILSHLNNKNHRLFFFDEISSTNSYCKDTESIVSGDVVIAKTQSQGRGRIGRSFLSGEGGIFMSYLPNEKITGDMLLSVTGVCGVAVCLAIEECIGVSPDIKWMNDVLVDGKKICGILTEAVFSGEETPDKIIVGIGINANQRRNSFGDELSEIATSLYEVTGKEIDLNLLVATVIRQLDKAFTALNSKKIEKYLAEYRGRCVTIGKRINVIMGEFCQEASALSVDDTFGLTVKFEDGTVETVRSGEATIRGIGGSYN